MKDNPAALPLTPDSLFSRDRLFQTWLDVEASLARVQARLGMIPDWAGDEIAAAASLSRIGRKAIEADSARTMAPILSMTRLLAREAGRAGAERIVLLGLVQVAGVDAADLNEAPVAA